MAEGGIAIKRYGGGKFVLFADCPEEHHAVVSEAMLKCADLRVIFDHKAFDAMLRAKGIPEPVISQATGSLRLMDETYATAT